MKPERDSNSGLKTRDRICSWMRPSPVGQKTGRKMGVEIQSSVAQFRQRTQFRQLWRNPLKQVLYVILQDWQNSQDQAMWGQRSELEITDA